MEEDRPPAAPATDRPTYPQVADWLRGASSKHWWVQMLDAVRHPDAALQSHADAFLTPMESLIGAIRAAGPQGMEKAKDRFATDLDNVLATRLELLCGAHLAWRRIPASAPAGSRISSGMPAPPRKRGLGASPRRRRLQHAATHHFDRARAEGCNAHDPARRLAGQGVQPQWRAPARLGRGRQGDRHRRGTDRGDPGARVGGDGGVVARENVPFAGTGRITVAHHGPLLSPSDDYRRTVAGKLKEKIERDKGSQAREGSWSPRTALLIDISAARQMRALESRDLARWLDGVPIDWDEHPFASVAICFTDLHSVSLTGACRYKPDLDAAARECLETHAHRDRPATPAPLTAYQSRPHSATSSEPGARPRNPETDADVRWPSARSTSARGRSPYEPLVSGPVGPGCDDRQGSRSSTAKDGRHGCALHHQHRSDHP